MGIVDWDKIDGAYDAATSAGDADGAWETEPVSFVPFNEGDEYLNAFPLSERQYYDVEQVIGVDPKQIFTPARVYSLGVFVWAKGAGKDLVISRLFCYVVYVLLCLKSPQRFLWMSDESVHMDIVNVARKGGQAKEIFFAYFKNTVKKAPFFRERYLIRESNRIESRPSAESRGTIDIGGDKIDFPKNIKAHAETSAFEGYEGFNVLAFVMDEASAFKSQTEQANAAGIYSTLRTSGSSRNTKNCKFIGFVISYPRQAEGDLTLELYNKSFKDNDIYGSFGWAWTVKPAHLFSGDTFEFRHERVGKVLFGDDVMCSVSVPVELKADFDENPTDAMCKHLCAPPHVQEAWVEYPDLFYTQLHSNDAHLIEYTTIVKDVYDHDSGKYEQRISLDFKKLNLAYLAAKETKFVGWLDAAEVFCDACFCIGHLGIDEVTGKEILYQDANLVWRPDPQRNIKISLADVERWITKVLPQHINLIAVGSDYWNSAALSEKMKTAYPNIRMINANLNQSDYDLMKKFVYTGQTRFRFESTVNQIVHLKNGASKPMKDKGKLQDQADGWVGCVKLLKGVDAAKISSLATAPATVAGAVNMGGNNLFSRNSPFSVNNQHGQSKQIFAHDTGAPTQRVMNMKDVRKILNVQTPAGQALKAWNDDKEINKTKFKLPKSITL